jgi:hypothetical protein
VITRLSDDAAAARRAAWPGGQPARPAPPASPDPAADEAAARVLFQAAAALLPADPGAGLAAASG